MQNYCIKLVVFSLRDEYSRRRSPTVKCQEGRLKNLDVVRLY